MYIIVGLGNIGREYENTRHNVGFMTLDILAQKYNIDIRRNNFHAFFGEGFIGGTKVLLAKPDTYMNNSGIAVRELMNFYKCEHDNLIIIYDDIDIPLGTLRIREGGSAGTHNGMRSIIYQLCYDDFPRIRVGIGAADGQRGLIAHVLSTPSGEDMEKLTDAMKCAANAANLIVKGEIHEAQALYNKKPQKPKSLNVSDDGKSDIKPESVDINER